MRQPHVMGSGIYFQSHLYFSHMRAKLLDLMIPSEYAVKEAEAIIKKKDLDGPVYCVHARRGDFLKAPHPQASEANFTRYATKWLLKKSKLFKYLLIIEIDVGDKPATVLFFSNDPVWMDAVFADVLFKANRTQLGYKYENIHYITPNTTSAFITLVLSRLYCDNVLVTAPASTFAWYMGFLANNGSGNVYLSETFAKSDGGLEKELIPSEFFLSNWIPLRRHDNDNFEKIQISEMRPFIPATQRR
ncbi:unnamed protein product, partial [Mesorhabditis spiculigera]